MGVVFGEMVDDAALLGMEAAAAEVFSADLLSRRRLHQGRSPEEDGALVAHNDALVAHRRHVGAARCAASHDASDLGNALRAHLGLVEEDPTKMLPVRKDLRLVRQVRASAVDQGDARQAVLLGDLLRAKMLLHRHWIIGATFYRGVVADDHDLAKGGAADGRGDPGARDFAIIHSAGGELPQFEERRSRIEQALDAIAGQKFAPLDMAIAMLLRTALRRFGDIRTQLACKRAVVRISRSELFVVRNDFAVDPRCAHAPRRARWSKNPAARVAATTGNGKAVARRNFQ